MKPLAPNTLLQNRYLVVQLIGKGGMGEVYLAVDQRLGSAMAVKRTFFNDEDQLKAAFEREAKILAMLRHPVLPKVSDHFVENDIQYLVMEHISGDDLGKRLEEAKQPFPVSWVLFWAQQLLDALAYLHGHEPPIIHRDIKPQNLKLTNENHIILLDFGLAKNSIGETRLTTSGTLSGYTPHYASMEQIRGTGTTAQSDIYSLSATLYQLLTNIVPPDALTRADNVLNNVPDSVRPINEINHEVSKAISDVILKGMNLSQDKRFKNAREMQSALREAAEQIQIAMAAKTEVFNFDASSGNVSEQIATLPQSQMQTEQYNIPVVSQPKIDNSQATPTKHESFSSQTGNQVSNHQQDFDATMQYSGQIFSGKEDVLSNNATVPTPHQFVNTQDKHNEHTNEDFDANSTMPIISFDNDIIGEQPSNKTEVMNFDSVPPVIPRNDMRTEEFPKQEKIVPPPEIKKETTPPVVDKTPKKKSGGKAFLVIGILLVLGVLGIGAAGIGIYLFKPSIITDLTGGTKTTPTATPIATPNVTPTVEISVTPTPEPSKESNTNSSTVGNTDNPTNTNSTNVDVDKTPRQGDKTPVPVPSATVKVAPTQKPTKAPTVAPTKAPSRDPGKIL